MYDKRRVLHVFGRMNRGGAELRTIEVLRYLRGNNDFSLHFCILSGLPGDLDDEIRSLGGHIHYTPLDASFIFKFNKLLKHEKFDVVHSHVQNFSGVILAIASYAKVKNRIAHFRNTHSDHDVTFLRRCQYSVTRFLINKCATNILAVCEGAMSEGWCRSWRNDPRCQIVYNGFDLTLYQIQAERVDVFTEFNIELTRNLIIHVGRMDPAKNHRRLAHIFARLVTQNPEVHLLLVGQGNNAIEKKLHEFFKKINIRDRVTFAGLRSDVPRLLAAADLMVFPSLWEGLPGAVIEARLTGLTVVASDLPGIREIASILGNVEILSLAESDDKWASVINQVVNSASKNIPLVSETPFAISFCAHELQKIWSAHA